MGFRFADLPSSEIDYALSDSTSRFQKSCPICQVKAVIAFQVAPEGDIEINGLWGFHDPAVFGHDLGLSSLGVSEPYNLITEIFDIFSQIFREVLVFILNRCNDSIQIFAFIQRFPNGNPGRGQADGLSGIRVEQECPVIKLFAE